MTPNSPRILGGLTETVIDLGMRLNPHDWARPSACPGWTVHDIFIHLTCTLREIAAPDTLPTPVPGSIERSNDAAVAAFRRQTPEETLQDYRALAPDALDGLVAMQDEPVASEIVDFDDAGCYPTHLVADSLVFDHFCHLRHDLGGSGPLKVEIDPTEEVMRSSLEWLMAGLPQMSPARLAQALDAPVALELTGPGGGTWTLRRTESGVQIFREGADAAARLISTADQFLRWGTHRQPWQEVLTISGEPALAGAVASAIHVF